MTASYKPEFWMPIVGPPPAGGTPTTYYAPFTSKVIATPSGVDQGLTITCSDSTSATVFAMAGGFLGFVPDGGLLPFTTGGTAPAGGAIVLTVWCDDVNQQRQCFPNVALPKAFVYLGLDQTSVDTALQNVVSLLPEAELTTFWENQKGTAPPSGTTLQSLIDYYVAGVTDGNAEVFVDGGTPLGNAGAVSSTDSSQGVTFELRQIASASNGSDQAVSPSSIIISAPLWSDADPPQPNPATSQWTSHPLVSQCSAVLGPTQIFLQFVYWDLPSGMYLALPAGLNVNLVENNAILGIFDSTAATVQIGLSGVAIFDVQQVDPATEIHFEVDTSSLLSSQGFPSSWSTKGWKTIDGFLIANYSAADIGTSMSPKVFRVGVDFHLSIKYQDLARGIAYPVLQGTSVQVLCYGPNDLVDFNSGTGFRTIDDFTPDQNGEIHSRSFFINPDDRMILGLALETHSSNPATIFPFMDQTFIRATAQYGIPSNYFTLATEGNFEIGGVSKVSSSSDPTSTQPIYFQIIDQFASAGLYCLKNMAELNTFMHAMNDGTWTWYHFAGVGVEMDALAFNSNSFPVGSVHITTSHAFKRDIQIHEISHQILWNLANYSNFQILYQGHLTHSAHQYRDAAEALLEGWAEFFAAAFTRGGSDDLVSVSPDNIVDKDGNPIAKITLELEPNWGEKVEGMFAGALLELLRSYVLSDVTTLGLVLLPETSTGDTTATAGWLKSPSSQAKTRFANVVIRPALAISSTSFLNGPGTTDFIDAIQVAVGPDWNDPNHRNDPSDWSTISPILQKFYIAIPAVDSIELKSGETGQSGNEITIHGRYFDPSATVTIGGVAVDDLLYTNTRTLIGYVPQLGLSAPKQVDVHVSTKFGQSTLVGGFNYQP
jgi:hypothetical protein